VRDLEVLQGGNQGTVHVQLASGTRRPDTDVAAVPLQDEIRPGHVGVVSLDEAVIVQGVVAKEDFLPVATPIHTGLK
jgi:hypothetical protein